MVAFVIIMQVDFLTVASDDCRYGGGQLTLSMAVVCMCVWMGVAHSGDADVNRVDSEEDGD